MEEAKESREQKIRYGEMQAGKLGMAIAALPSIVATTVDPSMLNKMSSMRSPGALIRTLPTVLLH